MAAARVSIQTQDFDLAAEVAALRAGDARVGAVCAFVGTVRDRNDGASVSTLELEHYPGMTEKAIEAMIDAAHARFTLYGARVVHRVGPLLPQDQIVLVAVTSAHRGEAFAACEFLMDYLKTQAPFWKKEQTPEGARWVDARVSDDAALARWGIAAGNAAGRARGRRPGGYACPLPCNARATSSAVVRMCASSASAARSSLPTMALS